MSETGRLSVNVTPATRAALDLVANREGVSITEALRRLVGYGELLYRTIRIEGHEVVTRCGNETDHIKLI